MDFLKICAFFPRCQKYMCFVFQEIPLALYSKPQKDRLIPTILLLISKDLILFYDYLLQQSVLEIDLFPPGSSFRSFLSLLQNPLSPPFFQKAVSINIYILSFSQPSVGCMQVGTLTSSSLQHLHCLSTARHEVGNVAYYKRGEGKEDISSTLLQKSKYCTDIHGSLFP